MYAVLQRIVSPAPPTAIILPLHIALVLPSSESVVVALALLLLLLLPLLLPPLLVQMLLPQS